jgi:sugar/nucleoside kinase (ribokinase family)
MATVHCIGVLVVDALSGPLPQYPVPRVRQQVNTRSIKFMPGGGAANTGAALAQLGLPTAIFSKVGNDLNGHFLREELSRKGTDVTHVRVSRRESTPFTFVAIHSDGDRTFIHTPGCNLTFSKKDLDLDALFACRFLLYQDLCVLPKLDGPAAPALLAGAQRRGVVTLLDECYGLGPNRKLFEAVLPYCDVALPSYDNLRLIYPGTGPREVAALLRRKGAKRVIVKLGKEGCLLVNRQGVFHVPSLAKKVVDTTGAGDCFNAGFIAGLTHGLDDLQAARVGAAAAAACIRNIGGAVGIPKYRALVRGISR